MTYATADEWTNITTIKNEGAHNRRRIQFCPINLGNATEVYGHYIHVNADCVTITTHADISGKALAYPTVAGQHESTMSMY